MRQVVKRGCIDGMQNGILMLAEFHYHGEDCSMKGLSEGNGGVEWCDQEDRSRQCMGQIPSLVPEKKKVRVFFQYEYVRIREANIINALRGTARFGGWPLWATRRHPSSAH